MAILDHLGKPVEIRQRSKPQRRRRTIRASYDAAAESDDSRKHWQAADSYNANASNDKATRQTLRDRSRYECANNCYAAGMIDQIADATIGTGPRLQLKIPDVPRTVARQIEKMYGQWAEQIYLAEKLRVLEKTKIRDGEGFALEITNPNLDPFLPQLDLRLYEAEQIADPYLPVYDPHYIDGIVFDDYGNPVEYHILKSHPGGDFAWFAVEYDAIAANRVRHYFRPDRPGQSRGIPEIMPALPLFAQMRRMTLAVLSAAEFAACISGVLESDQAPDYQGSDTENGDDPAFDRVEIERNALLTLPRNYKAKGFEASQPIATYGTFKAEILNEAGRACQVPGVIVSGDYSQLNYSSGRLANLPYHRSIRIRRAACSSRVLNPTFRSWLREAFVMGILPDNLPPIAYWSCDWQWDGFASVDPQKEAAARQTLLAAGLTTYADEFADDGKDWEEQFEQRAIEQARLKELGLTQASAPTPDQQAAADMPEEVPA